MKDETAPEMKKLSAGERITHGILHLVGAVTKSCGANAVFVYQDALAGKKLPLADEKSCRVFYVRRVDEAKREEEMKEKNILQVPNVELSRIGQAKIAIFLALSRGIIKQEDIIVFLTGQAASGTLDTIIVTEVGKEFEMLSTYQTSGVLPREIKPEVVDRVIDLAIELGSEGREGKPVGTLFIIGDSQKVLSLSRQLILNPFKGYAEEQRNILDERLRETVKELSSIDGAFLIRGDGIIESCGLYIKTASQEDFELPRGLGSRHHAAAAITSVTDSLAVTISESTGTVSVFKSGRLLVAIERTHKPKS